MCLLLTLAMPFFVTLPFCVASVAVRGCFRFYSLSLHPENVRVFFIFSAWPFYRHRVIFIVFIVLSFYLDLCTNFFSFCSI